MDNTQKVINILKKDNVFLTGGGGVGKSYLCNELIKEYKSKNFKVITLGSTGISAVGIGGQTLHSFFMFGICNNLEQMIKNDKKYKSRLKELYSIVNKCDLLIIDEISMVSADVLDMIKYRLQSCNYTGRVLFVGDFFQLPPVNKNISQELFSKGVFAFESLAWEYFEPKVVILDISKRTQDKQFFKILNKIRIGIVDKDVVEYLKILRENTDVWSDNPSVLFGRNKEANIMNTNRLSELKNTLVSFSCVTKIYDKSLHANKVEKFKKNLGFDENLDLKVGANVLFTANKKNEYYNGQRGIIEEILDDEIVVRKSDLSSICVKRHEYELSDLALLDGELKEYSQLSVSQFPLKLAYAITIHKSQGMSLEKLVCNIDHIFEKSQLYVALSRATNPKNLFLYYSKNNFENYINSCIKIDEKVVEFYEKCDSIYIEQLKE